MFRALCAHHQEGQNCINTASVIVNPHWWLVTVGMRLPSHPDRHEPLTALLDSILSESRWSLHISRPISNLQAFCAQEHKWNNIIMIWESQGNRTATEIITSQLQALQDAGLFSNKSSLSHSYLFQDISATSWFRNEDIWRFLAQFQNYWRYTCNSLFHHS
jgi:hypothetical protein